MATVEEVKKLAALARIQVPDVELSQFTKEFDAILAYVGQLEKLELPKDLKEERPALRNVYREDTDSIPAGAWTKKLTEAFPDHDRDYLVVKQIISHD